MANVRINRRTNCGQWGGLPPLCTRCGEPAEITKERTFSWCPGWVYILLLAGLVPLLIGVAFTIKRARLRLPFCLRHQNHWLWHSLLLYGGLAVLMFLVIVMGAVAAIAEDNPRGPAKEILGFACVGLVAYFLIWLVTVALVQAYTIRAGEITEDRVTLTGVSSRFRTAVIELRDRSGPPVALPVDEEESPPPRARPGLPDGVGTKLCPFCSEEIKATAVKCRFCGEFLD